jgi:hypothetical protein
MMLHLTRQVAIGALAGWLVLLSGLVYPQLTAHASQHVHHNAATHATALCSWLCAAGHTAESVAPPALTCPTRQSQQVEVEYLATESSVLLPGTSRGPPSVALSYRLIDTRS